MLLSCVLNCQHTLLFNDTEAQHNNKSHNKNTWYASKILAVLQEMMYPQRWHWHFFYSLSLILLRPEKKKKNTRRITACITVNKQSIRGGWVWGRKQLIHFKTCSRLMPFTSNQRQVINSLVQVDLCCSDLVDNTAVKWTHLQEMG